MEQLFNLNNFDKYKEDNSLEVKKADGGLPITLWETYSSFANSNGGVIILGVGERAGGGIPDIYQVWADQGWNSPVVEELYNPDRTRLSLDFSPKATKKTSEENKRRKQAKKTSEENKRRKTEENYIAIRKYLQQHGLSKTVDIAAAIELSPARTRVLLKEIPGVYFEGTNTNRKYYLIEE